MLRVTVNNFQSIARALIEIAGFTVVTGTNNTGKSALMRAIRGLLQNAKGTAYIRHGQPKTTVGLEFDDGHTVQWEKGRTKKDKPTYIIDGGKPIHPGQSVPDEVRELGIHPITAGGREVWPQIAPQFTGQVFLLDQPGSVLAEAVSDVTRVSQLNEALREAEGDKRRAAADLRVRRADLLTLTTQLEGFEGLDEALVLVDAVEEGRRQAGRIQTAIFGLQDLRDRLQTARGAVASLSTIEDVEIPSAAEAQASLVERDSLVSLRQRLDAATANVGRLEGVEGVQTDFDTVPVEKTFAALQVLRGLRSRWTAATERVTTLEKELSDTEEGVEAVTSEFQEMLGGMGECPLCGSSLAHQHEESDGS